MQNRNVPDYDQDNAGDLILPSRHSSGGIDQSWHLKNSMGSWWRKSRPDGTQKGDGSDGHVEMERLCRGFREEKGRQV